MEEFETFIQTKSRRKAPRREIIECSDGVFVIKTGKDKGVTVSGGKRMYVSACAARSKGLIKGHDKCIDCDKWIDVLKEIK